MLLFISAATPAAEINSKQNESLPDLGSQAAQQVEQTDKGKSLKERGADYVIDSATQGFENLTPRGAGISGQKLSAKSNHLNRTILY